MTPAQIAAIREALPKAERMLRPRTWPDVGNNAYERGRGAVEEACQPIIEAMPAVLDELERAQRDNERLRRGLQRVIDRVRRERAAYGGMGASAAPANTPLPLKQGARLLFSQGTIPMPDAQAIGELEHNP